jgi:hypothetical protein
MSNYATYHGKRIAKEKGHIFNTYSIVEGMEYVEKHWVSSLVKLGVAGLFFPISIPYMMILEKPFID